MSDIKANEEQKDISAAEGELSTSELEKVSGGTKKGVTGDPCEGGEFHAK